MTVTSVSPAPATQPATGATTSARIATVAAAACGTRYAGVSVPTADGVRLESSHGFDPATPPPAMELCALVVREERPVVVGDEGWFAGVPVTARNGDVVAVLWVADDLTPDVSEAGTEQLLLTLAEQLVAQAELRNLGREREQALGVVGASIFYVSRDGLLTGVSSSWETLTGYTVDETLGRPLDSFVQGDLDDPIGAVLAGTDSDSVRRFDRTLRNSDGAAIPVELALASVGRPGAPHQVLGVLTDLRERHRRELEARHDQKLESLGRLSAGIAHEINTPIQFVGDNTRFLASAYDEMLGLLAVYRECLEISAGEISWDERVRRAEEAERDADIEYLTVEVPAAAAQSLEGIERVASLVRAMKAFSYKDSSDRSYADLNEALQTTLTVARNEVKYVADVVFDLGDLPEVLCHVGDLNQVFLNLVVNAADALAENGVRGEIRIGTRTEGAMAVISVADNGPGIPEDLQRVIFEPFFTTKGVGKGTGQGLALARAVVADKHGGTIEVHSKPGEGTEFVLRLPVDGKRSGTA
jgi:PAS domain S-box-containing protein